jgi:hypothetical protein
VRSGAPRVTCRYTSRGLFLEPPTAGLVDGQWQVQLPPGCVEEAGTDAVVFAAKAELFDPER